MSTNYDPIAEDYQRSKEAPWRLHVEQFTFFQLLGDVSGKRVLDLACGEGFYTRRVRQRGAAEAVGVDLSPRMIELARAEESRRPQGLDYHVGDVKGLQLGRTFDLVVASYLLNYAQSYDELLAMCEAIARHLEPGGRFVTINNNPGQPVDTYAKTRKYGFSKTLGGELREGTAITYTNYFEDGRSFQFDNYYLAEATHERALFAAGLKDIRWHPPLLSPEVERADGKEYWADFLSFRPIVFLDCRK